MINTSVNTQYNSIKTNKYVKNNYSNSKQAVASGVQAQLSFSAINKKPLTALMLLMSALPIHAEELASVQKAGEAARNTVIKVGTDIQKQLHESGMFSGLQGGIHDTDANTTVVDVLAKCKDSAKPASSGKKITSSGIIPQAVGFVMDSCSMMGRLIKTMETNTGEKKLIKSIEIPVQDGADFTAAISKAMQEQCGSSEMQITLPKKFK